MTADRRLVQLSTESFDRDVLESSRPVLVDFWAPWCGPCRTMAPVLEDLAAEFDGHATVAKLNVDEYPEIASRHGIQAIPTLLFFRAGEVVDEVVGVAGRKELRERLSDLLEAA